MIDYDLIKMLSLTIAGIGFNALVKGITSPSGKEFSFKYAWIDNKQSITISIVTGIVIVCMAKYIPGSEQFIFDMFDVNTVPENLEIAGFTGFGFGWYAFWRNMLKKNKYKSKAKKVRRYYYEDEEEDDV